MPRSYLQPWQELFLNNCSCNILNSTEERWLLSQYSAKGMRRDMLQVEEPVRAQSWAGEGPGQNALSFMLPFIYPLGFRLGLFQEGWILYRSLWWDFAKAKHKWSSETIDSWAATICVVEELKRKDFVGSKIGNYIIWWLNIKSLNIKDLIFWQFQNIIYTQ